MKILLISNGFPPQRWAGTETYTAGVAGELAKRGHNVQVLCVGEWQKGSRYWIGYTDDQYHAVNVRRLNLNWEKAPDPTGYLYRNPFLADYLGKYLEQMCPDLVHVTSCETLSASILDVVYDAGIPLVLSLTDFWFLCPQINLQRSDGSNCNGITSAWECLECRLSDSNLYHKVRRILPERIRSGLMLTASRYPLISRQRGFRGMAGDFADRKAYLHKALLKPIIRITASQFVRNLYQANGIEASILVQPYGIDYSCLSGYSGKTRSDFLRIGFVGQMIESKGVHLLLQAAQLLQPEFGDRFGLVLYGDLNKDPSYGARLRQLATQIRHIEFRGTYSHEQSANVFASFDVLAVPSTWFDFPLIIQEALATKTPVVATDLGSISENIINNTNGLLFKRGDANDLSIQLEKIITEAGLLDNLQKGIQTVKSIPQEVDELSEIYNSLLHNRITSKVPEGIRSKQ
jgi:glycosyltransferase involved in cell wall biosynthesis